MRIFVAALSAVASFAVVAACGFSADANIRMCAVPAMALVLLNARALGIAIAER